MFSNRVQTHFLHPINENNIFEIPVWLDLWPNLSSHSSLCSAAKAAFLQPLKMQCRNLLISLFYLPPCLWPQISLSQKRWGDKKAIYRLSFSILSKSFKEKKKKQQPLVTKDKLKTNYKLYVLQLKSFVLLKQIFAGQNVSFLKVYCRRYSKSPCRPT